MVLVYPDFCFAGCGFRVGGLNGVYWTHSGKFKVGKVSLSELEG